MPKNKNSTSLCLIIPYYGKWPVYFELFLYTVAKQKKLNILLFSDIPYIDTLPSNMKLINLSLDNFNTLASEKLHIDINLTNPYKLCDLRPAYGVIFEDYLNSYSHWAFGDLDLIYGDMFSLLPKNWQDYDVLCFREEWLSGSLSIFKNIEKINQLYKKSKFHKIAFTSTDNKAFDECLGLYSVLQGKEMKTILTCDTRESFTWLVKTEEEKGELFLYAKRLIKESIQKNDYVQYKGAKLTQKDGREFLYYHYITEKNTFSFFFPQWKDIPNTFYIDKTGFFTEEEFFSWRAIVIRCGRMILGSLRFLKSLPKRIYNKVLRILFSK